MQGSHIKIRTNSELPVHVDGEPWIQAPGDIVVLKSALKVRPAHTMTVNGQHSSLSYYLLSNYGLTRSNHQLECRESF